LNRVFFLVVSLAACLAAPPSQAASPPIRSKAELDRYLQRTPIEATPLAPLPPAARRRFLAQLVFRPHGVDIGLGEPEAWLTHAQVVRLFALFGQQELADALGLGLTPDQKARRDREREEDARQRGCVPDHCPESEIERRFDQLSAISRPASMTDAERFAAEKRDYDRLFAPFQRADRLRGLSTPDLRLLARAVQQTLYAVPDAGHVAQLRDDLLEMQRRGITGDEDFIPLYRAEIGARQFDQAADLRRQHPHMDVPPLPPFVAGPTAAVDGPTALDVDVSSGTMHRRPIDLDGPLQILVIAGCHFSENAARAIEGDDILRPLFASHSIWLAAPSQPIEDVADWNRAFPDLPMHVAWRQEEWPMLPDWSMPSYYVFRHGRLARRFSGWLGVDKLKQSLREAGMPAQPTQ
jgi:hypothetical protein